MDPKCKSVMYIKSMIAVLIFVLGIVIVSVATEFRVYGEWYWYPILAAVILIIAYLLLRPGLFYRHYRYIVSSDKIDIRSGVIFLKRELVPIERIHQVELNMGPLSRMFGLADVTVTTAGGVVRIVYLEKDVAESIAEYINEKVNVIIRDRES